MKNILKRLFKKAAVKNEPNIYSICNNMPGDLKDYCTVEFTYRKNDNV